MLRGLFAAPVQHQGFLPKTTPATTLPEHNEYQVEINRIIATLPVLLKEKNLRKTVDELNAKFPDPALQLDKGSKSQKAAALCFLTVIAHAYVNEDKNPIEHVPAAIAKPLYALSKSKQRFPTITYADYVLNNWRLLDASQPISLANIEPIATFTNTKDEAWFIKIHVVIESIAARALTAAKRAFDEANNENPDLALIKRMMDEITSSLNSCVDVMHQMQDGCDPGVFWDTLRPYLAGWEKVKPLNCDDAGVRLQGIPVKDSKPFAYSGPSGAQSSIVPALDAALKIKHEIDGMFAHLLKFKEYMPNEDQAFILQFANSKIRHCAKHANDGQGLDSAFDGAVDAVKRMRGAHLGLVHAYIYKPAGAQGIPYAALTGTGGAPIDGYLGGRFNGTNPLRK